MRANARDGWLLRGSIDAAAPRHVYADLAPQRGHALLELGTDILRPVAFSTEAWKSFLNANWGAALCPLACERTLPRAPQTPKRRAGSGGCMEMASMNGRMLGEMASMVGDTGGNNAPFSTQRSIRHNHHRGAAASILTLAPDPCNLTPIG